jgi:hypothetical protein
MDRHCAQYNEVDCIQRQRDELRRQAATQLQQEAARKKRKWKKILKKLISSPFGE